MTGGQWQGRRASAHFLWLAAFFLLLCTSGVGADSRTAYLVGLLRESDAFRVRAQAALSLGGVESTRAAVSALEAAVADEHPAVRVAAITSLKNLRQVGSLPVIEHAARDKHVAVQRAANEALATLRAVGTGPLRGPGTPRYYVAVGMPGTKTSKVSRQMLFDAQAFMSEQLLALDGVELMPQSQSAAQSKSELQRRRLTGYFLDSSVLKLEDQGSGVRAEVSVIVATYPGRDMRAMLRGAATASGRFDEATSEQAIQGAIVGALRRLPQAMQASAERASR